MPHEKNLSPISRILISSSTPEVFARAAMLFFTVSALGMFYLFSSFVKQSFSKQPPPTSLSELLIQQSMPIMAIIFSLIAALIGYLLLRGAGRFTKEVIPEKDRELLTGLIREEREKGIGLYVTLSSLTGATGVFQKLGLVGLPLTTVGLTVLFTALSLALSNTNKEYSEKLLDLAKLTLGAFIGSYVQRQASEGPKTLPNPSQGLLPTTVQALDKPVAPAPDKPAAPPPNKPAAPPPGKPAAPAPDKPAAQAPDKPAAPETKTS
ncbi:MAG: hypothetical protein ACRD72_06205 [Candidatus Angelobacter sp.]